MKGHEKCHRTKGIEQNINCMCKVCDIVCHKGCMAKCHKRYQMLHNKSLRCVKTNSSCGFLNWRCCGIDQYLLCRLCWPELKIQSWSMFFLFFFLFFLFPFLFFFFHFFLFLSCLSLVVPISSRDPGHYQSMPPAWTISPSVCAMSYYLWARIHSINVFLIIIVIFSQSYSYHYPLLYGFMHSSAIHYAIVLITFVQLDMTPIVSFDIFN